MGMLGKKEIRAEVKKRRREADEETLHEKSLQILERFRQLSAYKDASLLLAYVDGGGDTVSAAWSALDGGI